jgi:NAD(P)H dehydrogenase (quinone)
MKMQVLVMYYSASGNTEKLAGAIAQGVKESGGVQYVLKAATDVTNDDLVASDAIIAGSPVYYGAMAAELKTVFDQSVIVRNEMEDKIGAAFATSGDPSGGKETTLLSIIQAMLISGMIIVGDPLDATGHYGTSCVGAPDAKAAENGKKLGRRVAELVKKLKR